MNALYVGTADDEGDFTGLDDWFKDVYPNNLIDSNEHTFDTFYDKLLDQVKNTFKIWNCFVNFICINLVSVSI